MFISFEEFVSREKSKKQSYLDHQMRSFPDEKSSAALYGTTSSLQTLEEEFNKSKDFKIFYSKKVKRVHLQRVLLTKLVWDWENFTLEELLIIYDNLLYLQDFCKKQPTFSKKFGETLEVLAKILKRVDLSKGDPLQKLVLLQRQIKKDLEGFILPRRNLQNQYRLVRKYVTIKNQSLGIVTKELPPKKYVGKGYTDKGTAKNSAKDGSPSWQEVAMSLGDLK